MDDLGYQPYCVPPPETETSTPGIIPTPDDINQALVQSHATSVWLWATLVFALLAVATASLLRVRAKSKLLEAELVRVKAESRQYRMKSIELQNVIHWSNQATYETSKIETQSEEISSHGFRAKVFRTAKNGEPLGTCADMTHANEKDQVFAIGDGVSQSFNPAKWAELLVVKASEGGNLSDLLKQVQHLSADWEADCSALLKDEEPLSFIRQKQLQGSQSTLAVLRLVSISDSVKNWQFSTIGDSLLVVLDASKPEPLIKRFYPFTDISNFPAGPDIIATKPPYLRGHVKTFQFESVAGESCLLMTDALARYALSYGAVGFEISTVFPFLNTDQHDFESWIEITRKSGLGDDDSTLILISSIYE